MDNKDLIFGIYVNDKGPQFAFHGKSKDDCFESTVAALVLLMSTHEDFRKYMLAGFKAFLDAGDKIREDVGSINEVMIDRRGTKS